MRGRVRARLLVCILGAVSGDLGSTVLTQTYEIGEWKAFGNRIGISNSVLPKGHS